MPIIFLFVIKKKEVMPSLVKPLVFGGIDGLTTTLALLWGSIAIGESLVSSKAVVILGVANLFATGLSMGIGDYVGSLAELEEQYGAALDSSSSGCIPGGPSDEHRGIAKKAALRSGITMFLSFVIFGGIPLATYAPVFGALATRRVVSSLLCLLSFFALGLAKSRIERKQHLHNGKRTTGSVCRSSLQMMVVGTGAAVVSFCSSKLIYSIMGVDQSTA